MRPAQKLLDLFYRLHWALRAGDEFGYGNRSEDIAAGKMPEGDIYEGRHSEIYSTAINLYISYKVPLINREEKSFVTVYVEFNYNNEWKITLNWSAYGAMSAYKAKPHSDALSYAVKVAKLCEEIVGRPIDYDLRSARQNLENAIQESWKSMDCAGVREVGDPNKALEGALERLTK